MKVFQFNPGTRAFVVEHPCSDSRIVFVSADLGQVFQGVHLEVVKRLQEESLTVAVDDTLFRLNVTRPPRIRRQPSR